MASQTRPDNKAFDDNQLQDNTSELQTPAVLRAVRDNARDSAVFGKTDSFTRNGGDTGGTTTAYTLTLSDFYPAANTANIFVTFRINATNTGSAPTLNINGIGAVTMKKGDGTGIIAGDLIINQYYGAVYNGTDFLVAFGFGAVQTLQQVTDASNTLTTAILSTANGNTFGAITISNTTGSNQFMIARSTSTPANNLTFAQTNTGEFRVTESDSGLRIMTIPASGLLVLNNGADLSGGVFNLANGTTINEISIDGTLAGNSDDAVPTEKAVKTFVDAKIEEGTFTPTALNYSGVMTVVNASYQKIGNLVMIQASLAFDGTADASSVVIDGFPFDCTTVSGYVAIGRATRNVGGIYTFEMNQGNGDNTSTFSDEAGTTLIYTTISSNALKLNVAYLTE